MWINLLVIMFNILMMKHDDVDNKGHVNFNVEHTMYADVLKIKVKW